MDSAYLHTMDPFMVQFTATLGIRWYGMAYLTGFLVTLLIVWWMGRKRLTQIPVSETGSYIFALALGTFLGGRLGYVIFYHPQLLAQFTTEAPFWGVLAINQGGMASHGAIIGILVACYLFSRKHRLDFPHLVDMTVIGGTVGIFFGRIANFINGELLGRPCPVDFGLAVKFPQEILLWPSQDFSKLFQLGDTVEAIGGTAEDWAFRLYQLTYSPEAQRLVFETLKRIILEIQQGNARAAELIEPLLTARHPSQLYAAFSEGLLVLLALIVIWKHARKPGVIAGWYFVIYATVRILGEQFRMPDINVGLQLHGLTQVYLLSAVTLGLGLAFLVYCVKRDVPAVGGWKDRVDSALALPNRKRTR